MHLVDDISHFLQILKMRAIGVESPLALGANGERVDQEFGNTTRVNLEVKTPGDRILPQLCEYCSVLYI